jgi:hypothetical protein
MEELFTINARITTKIWDLLDRVGMKEITKYVDTGNYLPTWKFVEENIFGLK